MEKSHSNSQGPLKNLATISDVLRIAGANGSVLYGVVTCVASGIYLKVSIILTGNGSVQRF